ncbi:MAG: hypothetical protein ABI693_34450 [Bryobacteraceae bacterium]
MEWKEGENEEFRTNSYGSGQRLSGEPCAQPRGISKPEVNATTRRNTNGWFLDDEDSLFDVDLLLSSGTAYVQPADPSLALTSFHYFA